MAYPADHFPGTPRWVQAAVDEAITRASLAVKWQVPMECIGRYESNYGVNANFCDLDQSLPVGMMQLGRAMLLDAKKSYPSACYGLQGLGNPVLQVLTAMWHINGDLNVTGGYGGLGAIDGVMGLLPRTDKGPGNVLRLWVANPDAFSIEGARSVYEGY